MWLATATVVAAENKNECKDYNPGAAVIKKTAKAVVHDFPPEFRGLLPLSISYYDELYRRVTRLQIFF